MQFVLCPRQDDVDNVAAATHDAQQQQQLLPTSCVHPNTLEVIFLAMPFLCTIGVNGMTQNHSQHAIFTIRPEVRDVARILQTSEGPAVNSAANICGDKFSCASVCGFVG